MSEFDLAQVAVAACEALRRYFETLHRGEPTVTALAHAERLWLDLERDAYLVLDRHAKWRREG